MDANMEKVAGLENVVGMIILKKILNTGRITQKNKEKKTFNTITWKENEYILSVILQEIYIEYFKNTNYLILNVIPSNSLEDFCNYFSINICAQS